MSDSENQEYLKRKGLIDQKMHLTKNNHKNYLLEYFVEDSLVRTFWNLSKNGWRKFGSYKSYDQAIRVMNSVIAAKTNSLFAFKHYEVPKDCKWRINGDEIKS